MLKYANKSLSELASKLLRGSVDFFAKNYFLFFVLVFTIGLCYAMDLFNLRTESILSERAKLEEREWK